MGSGPPKHLSTRDPRPQVGPRLHSGLRDWVRPWNQFNVGQRKGKEWFLLLLRDCPLYLVHLRETSGVSRLRNSSQEVFF